MDEAMEFWYGDQARNIDYLSIMVREWLDNDSTMAREITFFLYKGKRRRHGCTNLYLIIQVFACERAPGQLLVCLATIRLSKPYCCLQENELTLLRKPVFTQKC